MTSHRTTNDITDSGGAGATQDSPSLRRALLSLALGAALGACGVEGPAGADGARGADGADGADGIDGADGEDGADGADGADGTDGVDGTPPHEVALPGAWFYPESVIAREDGTLLVTSIATGVIATVDPRAATVQVLVGPDAAQPIGKTGLLVDEAADALWVCAVATDYSVPSELRRYVLSTGAHAQTIALTNGGVCNDIARDDAGTLYVTDSFFGVLSLAPGADALETFVADALLQPQNPGAFAADGIVRDGASLFVNNLDTGALVRIAIEGDGSAGTPTAIAGVALGAPDGMRLRAPGRILVAESSADTLSEIVIDAEGAASRAVLSNRLDRPSAVAVAGDDAWVAEGQIGRLFGLDPTPTRLPFLLRRVPLP